MEITIHNTSKIVKLLQDDLPVQINTFPARIWEGKTQSGIAVHCYVTRIAVSNKDNTAEFERELQECVPPSSAVQAIPLRMIL